jgi:hypothetical protein
MLSIQDEIDRQSPESKGTPALHSRVTFYAKSPILIFFSECGILWQVIRVSGRNCQSSGSVTPEQQFDRYLISQNGDLSAESCDHTIHGSLFLSTSIRHWPCLASSDNCITTSCCLHGGVV